MHSPVLMSHLPTLGDKYNMVVRDPPEPLPVPFPVRLWLYQQDQSQYCVYEVLDSRPEPNPEAGTLYVMYRNGRFTLCWFVNVMKPLYVVKLTVFLVNPKDNPLNFMCAQQLWRVRKVDSADVLVQQQKVVRDVIQKLPWKLHAKVKELQDCTVAVDVWDIFFIVSLTEPGVVRVHGSKEASVALGEFNVEWLVNTVIIDGDKIKQLLLGLQNTKKYSLEYDGDVWDEGIEFPYMGRRFFYYYDDDASLVVRQLRPWDFSHTCHRFDKDSVHRLQGFLKNKTF